MATSHFGQAAVSSDFRITRYGSSQITHVIDFDIMITFSKLVHDGVDKTSILSPLNPLNANPRGIWST